MKILLNYVAMIFQFVIWTFPIDIQAQRELLESELVINGDIYEYFELKNDQKKVFENIFLKMKILKK